MRSKHIKQTIMRNSIFTFFFLFLTSSLAGQLLDEGHTPQFKFGIQGGYNYATAVDRNMIFAGVEGVNLFHLGVCGDIHLVKRFSLEPSLLINRKGFGLLIESGPLNEYKLDYVGIQLLGKIHLTKAFRIMIGGEVARLGSVTRTTIQFEREFFNDLDNSFIAGLEISILDKLSIYAKYQMSINTTLDIFVTDMNGIVVGDGILNSRNLMIGATFYPFRVEVL